MNAKDLMKIPLAFLAITKVKGYGYLVIMSFFILPYFTGCERFDELEKESVTIDDSKHLKTANDRTDEFYENFEENAEILLGPEILIIEGETSKLYKFQIDQELFEHFEEPFVLYLKNGSGIIETGVKSAKVLIDGQVIISPRGFNQNIESLRRQIQLTKNSEIEILIEGESGSFCELTIKGIGDGTGTVSQYPSAPLSWR